MVWWSGINLETAFNSLKEEGFQELCVKGPICSGSIPFEVNSGIGDCQCSCWGEYKIALTGGVDSSCSTVTISVEFLDAKQACACAGEVCPPDGALLPIGGGNVFQFKMNFSDKEVKSFSAKDLGLDVQDADLKVTLTLGFIQ